MADDFKTVTEAKQARAAEPITVPFYASPILWGAIISVILKLIWVVFKYKPPISDADMIDIVKEVSIIASFLGDAIIVHGRVTSKLQPVTLTDQR